jgi:flavodoxin I
MSRIGIFYSTRTGGTERVARLLRRQLEPAEVDLHDVTRADPHDVAQYDLVIFGTPTWEADRLPREWAQFADGLDGDALAGRKVALYGLGDTRHYPAHYIDAMGALHDRVVEAGAEVVGETPSEEMRCYRSSALRDGNYVGLPLDEDNQPELVYHRVRQWARQLRDEIGEPPAAR